MLTREEFLKHLRGALIHLQDPNRLRQSPLAALFGVSNRFDTPLALQRILVKAIESLEPKADEPSHSRAWRTYESLFYRYVQQFSQREVADQMGMSARQLRRDQTAALETLACRLWTQFDLEAKLHGDTGIDMTPAQTTMTSPAVNEELAWLKDIQLEKPTHLEQMLSDLLDLARPHADRRGVRLDIAAPDVLPDVAVHPVALNQILLNLLGVAIHQASRGQVHISVTPLRWEVIVRVQAQVQSTRPSSGPTPTSDEDTTGLGMAKQLADLSRCKLAISDGAEAFSATLTLPVLEQLPVLAIDDNVDTLHMLQRYASGTRYRLVTTRDPEQALRLAEQFSPQIIVLDIMMPQVDGWKVLGRLRQHPHLEHIPIIVCTILAQEELAFSLGASGFVHKPVTRQDFLAALNQQIELLEPERR